MRSNIFPEGLLGKRRVFGGIQHLRILLYCDLHRIIPREIRVC